MGKKEKTRKGRIYIPYEKEDKGPSWIGVVVMLCIFWPVGIFLGLKKLKCIWDTKKLADYRNYAVIIGDRCEVDIREMSAKLGKTPSLVASDLQVMIDKGYLGSNAYVDKSRGVLVVDATVTSFVEDEIEEEVVEEVIRKVKVETVKADKANEKVRDTVNAERETVREARAEKARQPEASVWQDDEFEGKLRQIRRLNDEIDDEAVSARIDRIGELTASIFHVVREKPDRADEVKKFLNYYLPTTFKLLKSYSLMEKQSFQGENIASSRKKIEGILDQLIAAFEQQQDRLFRADALDVEADIEVLETMMAKDGLVTPKGLDLRSMTMGQK